MMSPMRTMPTLDDDLARQLHEMARRKGESFKEVVNSALRRGLHGEKAAARLPKFKVIPKACGFRSGVDVLRLSHLNGAARDGGASSESWRGCAGTILPDINLLPAPYERRRLWTISGFKLDEPPQVSTPPTAAPPLNSSPPEPRRPHAQESYPPHHAARPRRGELRPATWDEALDRAAAGFPGARSRTRPDVVRHVLLLEGDQRDELHGAEVRRVR